MNTFHQSTAIITLDNRGDIDVAKVSWSPPPDGGANFSAYLDYLHASVEILCKNYGPVGGFWFDGNWAHKEADWKEDRLYELIRRHQPDAMIINNTGIGAEGAMGHAEIDSTTFEQGLPTMPDRRGWKKYLAGEMCQTLNSHWGIGANELNYLSPVQVIENLCLSRKVGANYLLNVGPTAQGGIPDYEGAVLKRVGDWVRLHEQAIRRVRPAYGVRCQGRDFVLKMGSKCCYFAFNIPIGGNEHVTVAGGLAGLRACKGLNVKIRSIRWIDNGENLRWTQDPEKGILALDCTPFPYGTHLVVRVAEIS